MLEVYDRNLRKTALLENALTVVAEQCLGRLWHLSFALPDDDEKNAFCTPFSFVKLNRQLYRILPAGRSVSRTGLYHYHCEHVWGTLADTCIFGFLQLGGTGISTRKVLEALLARQSQWRLGECQFSWEYTYGFSQESLLSAIMAVPACFTQPHRWDFDTSTLPWTLHLRRLDPDALPSHYLHSAKNLLSCTIEEDLTRLCTRLYPLGYGEGVNQLTIASVNGGKPYLQSPKAITDKYGVIERVWVDRQYEDAASLKAAGQRMLLEMQEPYRAYEVSMQELAGESVSLGDVVQTDLPGGGFRAYVTAIRRNYGEVTETTITIANHTTDLADTIATLADKARIEASYAQGATNLYAQSLQANADPSDGACLHFYLPKEMRQVNKVLCRIKLERFRAYSKTTSAGGRTASTSSSSGNLRIHSSGGGGANVSTSGGGGGSTDTSGGGSGHTGTSSGGSGYTGTSSGGNVNTSISGGAYSGSCGQNGGSWYTGQVTLPVSSETTADKPDGLHRHTIKAHSHIITNFRHTHTFALPPHSHTIQIPAHSHTIQLPAHSHTVSLPEHSHTVSLPAHSHTVTIQPHNHTISGGNHSHQVEIPDHSHGVKAGIHRFGAPKSFQIYVNGVYRQTVSATAGEYDVTAWLTTLQDGRIGRDRWHRIEIVPDDLAYVVLDLFVQGFVQSRGDFTL